MAGILLGNWLFAALQSVRLKGSQYQQEANGWLTHEDLHTTGQSAYTLFATALVRPERASVDADWSKMA